MTVKTNRVRFTVEFDSGVWLGMSDEEKSQWIDDVNDVLSDEVYVANVEVNV